MSKLYEWWRIKLEKGFAIIRTW